MPTPPRKPLKARNEESPDYLVGTAKPADTADDDAIIARALSILEARARKAGTSFTSPQTVKDYCRLHISALEHEVFAVLFLDAQHRLIEWQVMFRGTLMQTSVYPREVVKEALRKNAGAVIICHNHPSGMAEPSRADEFLTQTIKSALALIDVRVLDHLVIGATEVVSFAERGLL